MARRAMASLLFLIHPPSSMDCHEPVVGLEDDARAMSRPTPPRPRWICNRHRTQRPPSFRERRGTASRGWESSPPSLARRGSNHRGLYVERLGYENEVSSPGSLKPAPAWHRPGSSSAHRVSVVGLAGRVWSSSSERWIHVYRRRNLGRHPDHSRDHLSRPSSLIRNTRSVPPDHSDRIGNTSVCWRECQWLP